jgi:hypothetical protein
MKQAASGRHRQQRRYLRAAARLPEQHHLLRIAAEFHRAVAHPV